MHRTIRYLPRAAHRVLIFMNPTAGAGVGGERAGQLQLLLERDGWRTETLHELPALRETVSGPGAPTIRAVVAAGGDGTVSAVVNATPPDTPIAVLPLGTENLLAKYLEYPFSLTQLSHTITHGAVVAIDAGRAGNRLFLLMAGCGFDAHVVRRLHLRRRGHIRHTSYVKPILESIRRYEYPEMRVCCEPCAGAADTSAGQVGCGTSVLTARWVFVVNLPKYAGGLRLAPAAVGTDGLLDVCLFERGSFLHGLRYLTGIWRGRHHEWADVRRFSSARIRIESDREVPYQLDGDPGGVLPVEITALPGRVCTLVTEAWAVRHGFTHGGETTAP